MTPEQFAAMLADRDAGTQGPFEAVQDRGLTLFVVAADNHDTMICEVHTSNAADARRFARVDMMEAEIIRLRDALDKAEARKVKPLVWVVYSGFWQAETIFGKYHVSRTPDGYEYGLAGEEFGHIGLDADVRSHQSARVAATAAAQADYETRILSALESDQ